MAIVNPDTHILAALGANLNASQADTPLLSALKGRNAERELKAKEFDAYTSGLSRLATVGKEKATLALEQDESAKIQQAYAEVAGLLPKNPQDTTQMLTYMSALQTSMYRNGVAPESIQKLGIPSGYASFQQHPMENMGLEQQNIMSQIQGRQAQAGLASAQTGLVQNMTRYGQPEPSKQWVGLFQNFLTENDPGKKGGLFGTGAFNPNFTQEEVAQYSTELAQIADNIWRAQSAAAGGATPNPESIQAEAIRRFKVLHPDIPLPSVTGGLPGLGTLGTQPAAPMGGGLGADMFEPATK